MSGRFTMTITAAPDDIDELGHRIVRAFDVRERPFHFEFFRLPDGELAALEGCAIPGCACGGVPACTRAAAERCRMSAVAGEPGSPELSVTDRLDQRRSVTAGTRAYEVGTQDGRYPALGFHTAGEMGGIWTPPLKCRTSSMETLLRRTRKL